MSAQGGRFAVVRLLLESRPRGTRGRQRKWHRLTRAAGQGKEWGPDNVTDSMTSSAVEMTDTVVWVQGEASWGSRRCCSFALLMRSKVLDGRLKA